VTSLSNRRVFAPAALALLTLALCGAEVYLWKHGKDIVGEPERIAPHPIAPLDLSGLDAPTAKSVDFGAIRDSAVFYSRRTFYSPPVPSQVIPPPDYDFAGSMTLPQGRKVAFVKKKGEQINRAVHVGEDLDGWRVSSVGSNGIVVVRDDRQIELNGNATITPSGLIHKEAAMAPATPAGLKVLGAQGTASIAASAAIVTTARSFNPPRNP
jgi:hypothetical protein